jgi:hypothetical protein
MTIRQLFTSFIFCCAAFGLKAQCTSFAGNLTLPGSQLCEGQELEVTFDPDLVADADDIRLLVAFTGATPNAGNVFASSTLAALPFNPLFLTNTPFNVAVVVGNNAGGTVDWADPCLSVSNAQPVSYTAAPNVGNVFGGTLSCVSTAITLIPENINPGISYAWSGPLGFTSTLQNPLVFYPGEYCLIVTNAQGCTATACTVVTQDVTPPPADAGQDQMLTCNTPSVTIGTPGWGPNYAYQWSGPGNFTATQPQVQVNASGLYTLTVTDVSNGCTTMDNVAVAEDLGFPSISTQVSYPDCDSATINILALPPQGIAYNWSDPGFVPGPTQTNVAPGTYFVTITAANGCTSVITVVVSGPPQLDLQITTDYEGCNSGVAFAAVSGGTAPYQYSWSNGILTAVVAPLTPGVYTVTVRDANGCSTIGEVYIQSSVNGPCGFIEGRVANDTDLNCAYNSNEPLLAGWVVQAIGADTLYGVSDTAGHYRIAAPLGFYIIRVLPPSPVWEQCVTPTGINVAAPDITYDAGYTMVKAQVLCPSLEIELNTPFLRRCIGQNSYFVSYRNNGSVTAENAYVLLELDPYFIPLSSNPPYTIQGNQLRFDLGAIPPNVSGFIQVVFSIDCNAVIGQTHCTTAHIYPDSSCLNGNWNGPMLVVNSTCNNDSLHFNIKNIGLGDMASPSNYIVIEDHVMLMSGPFQLPSGDSVTVAVPANGSTWRLQTEQIPGSPIASAPVLSIEGCTSSPTFSTGFVTQFSNGDEDPWLDIDCRPNQGSYDPNDKQGSPLGYGSEHYIEPGTEIEYLIRFQNTGTDTAFTVIIRDELTEALDPATIKPGPSSHPYRFEMRGEGKLIFRFENILLPDSNVNEAASHGFVRFKIRPRADLPLGSVIENYAAIFFDLNDPVITNTTRHKLGINFISTATWNPLAPGIKFNIMPNPMQSEALIELEGLSRTDDLRLEIFDVLGKIQQVQRSDNARFLLTRGQLPTGIYWCRVIQNERLLGSAKIIVE